MSNGVRTRDDALALDRADPLAARREQFILPAGVLYLDGNSLGAMPVSVPPRVRRAVDEEWAHGLIRSWNDADWYQAPQRVGAKIATLIGAGPHEVIVCDSTSVDLFKVMMAAARMSSGRTTIVADTGNFPTNAYITSEVARLSGLTVVFVPPAEVAAAIDSAGEELAFIQLTEVHYKTAERYDMAEITRQVHFHGGLTVWDLCHSAGALPVDLNGCDADFAVGCTYKYLNGGPGSPAFVFVAERHLAALDQPLPGWHGHVQPFGFAHAYEPAAGISRLLTGTAPQLSLLALEAALEAFDGVDMAVVRAKSLALAELFIALVDTELADFDFALASPRDGAQRGSHVSLAHPHAYPIMQALIEAGVIGDVRAPDILRFGLTPLYLRYVDIWDAVATLRAIMQARTWDTPRFHERKIVT